jgi:hypothetical protein
MNEGATPGLKRTASLLAAGGLCVIAAAVLVWYASPATLSLTRTAPDAVSVSMASKLFGRLTTATTRYDGVRSAAIVLSPNRRREVDSDRLVFYTVDESIDRTGAQRLFRADFPEIRDFLADGGRQALTISSIARPRELRRFVAAHVAVVFLALLGLSVIWLGVMEVRRRNRDVLIRGVDY